MLIEQTLARLHELSLNGMADALEEQRGVPDIKDLPFEDRFALLLDREGTVRENRRRTRLLKQAKLRLPSATIEELDFRAPRGLDKSVVLRLAGCAWVTSHQVTILTGATGTGKTFLSCALGHNACRHGLSVRYFRLSRLLDEMRLARADGTYPRLLNRLLKTALLIIDDFGLQPLNEVERRDLLEVLEDRYARRATLVASQLPLEHWHDIVGDATFGDAILDRLVHHAHSIHLKGASMRRHKSKTSS